MDGTQTHTGRQQAPAYLLKSLLMQKVLLWLEQWLARSQYGTIKVSISPFTSSAVSTSQREHITPVSPTPQRPPLGGPAVPTGAALASTSSACLQGIIWLWHDQV